MATELDAPDKDFIMTEGDTQELVIERLKDDGTAWDITNWTFWLTVKESPGDADTDAVIGPKKNTTHSDPTNGKTKFTLTASETTDLSRRYHYDVQQKRPSGSIQTVLIGTMYFTADVTEETT